MKLHKSIPVFFFLALVLPLKAQSVDTLKFHGLSPAGFRDSCWIYNGIIIDVRETFEFKKSRITGAVNIPSSTNERRSYDTIKWSEPLFLYCTSGFRSSRVAKSLYNLGYRNLFSLDGGFSRWKKDGLPVDKKKLRHRDR